MTTLKPDNITMNVHRGTNGGYAIVADKYPIFAFGKTFATAHARFIRACDAYDGKSHLKDTAIGIGTCVSLDQPLYGTSFMR